MVDPQRTSYYDRHLQLNIFGDEEMVDVEKAKNIIPKILERIKSECQPTQIILFGSYAHGMPTEDSDIDILIVTQERLSPEEIYNIRRELLKGFSIPVQLICLSGEEFTETKDVIGGIAYPAAKYGEVLYEKS